MNLLRWVVILLIPFLLAAVVTTLVIQPWYPKWEYGKANFPADAFGWTQAERLDLALVSVDFLRSWGSADDTIYMLAEQTFPDSADLLFTPNEVDHMHDVKVRTNLIRVAIGVLGVIVVGGLWMIGRGQGGAAVWRTIQQGGVATGVILVVFGAMIGLAWQWFFTTFHEVLFPAGNWSFPYSSSLIRLFPNKFWLDVGIVIVASTLLLGLLLAVIGWLMRRT